MTRDQEEGWPYSVRPKTPRSTGDKRRKMTAHPMIYRTKNGRYEVRFSGKNERGEWKQKTQRVDTMKQALRLRRWFKGLAND